MESLTKVERDVAANVIRATHGPLMFVCTVRLFQDTEEN